MAKALDWDDLRFVLAAAEEGSLGAAARALGVRASTVSRRLEAAEAALGVALFERTREGLGVTEAGQAVARRAREVELAVREVERAAAGSQPEVTGVVTVSAPPTVAVALVAPALASLAEAHPTLTVTLREEADVVSLERGEADVAVRLMRPERARLVAQRVTTIRYCVAASRAYLDAFGRPGEGHAGEGHRLVTYGPPFELLQEARWLRERFPAARVAFRAASQMAQSAMLARGAGIGLVPTGLLPEPLEPIEEVPFTRPVWLATHEASRHLPAGRAVTEHLAAALREA